MVRVTTEQFIEEAKGKHGERYDYSCTRYVNSEVKVDIICSVHGIFSQFPANHIKKGCGCRLCANTASRLTQEQFILKALEKHGDKFDYCRTVYKELESEIEVICNIHGAFYTRANNHIATISGGCKHCGNILKTAGLVSDIEEFIRKATRIHGDKYDYSNSVYLNAATPIDIICPIHGLFKQRPNAHTQGKGCKKCGSIKTGHTLTKSKEAFVNAANNLHKNKYSYETTIYVTDSVKIDIICPAHGTFRQSPSCHLQGSGCPVCKKENASRWTAESWANAADNSSHFKQFTLYFTRLYRDEESFHKIGITYRDVHTRLQKIASYKHEVIHVLMHEDPEAIYNLEKYLKRTFKSYRYQPLKPFAGSKFECFKFDDPTIQSVLREMTLTSSSDIIPTSTK